MLRDDTVNAQKFMQKFRELKKKFDERVVVHLDSEYHQQLKMYIERLYVQTCETEEMSDKVFDDIREAEMSNLNRLQKLKNGTSYKKDKHKAQHQNEDWG
jgi:predicted RNA-binding protein